MADTIGELAIKVTADTRELASKIQRDATTAGSKWGRGISTGFKTIGVAALAAGAAGAGAAVLGAKFGLDVAAANQSAAVSFQTLLGSGEKADAFLRKLGAFAAATPFELPELRDAASRLIATGVEAKRVIPIMESLGDSTAAMGTGAAGIDRAVTALQQMSNAGRVTGGDMNQLASAGIPAWNALAAAIGKSPGQVRELVAKGKIEVDTLLDAIQNKTGSTFAKVSGTMEAQSQTFAGQLSTLKDTLSQTMGEAAKPLLESFQSALPDVTAAVGGLADGLKPAFAAIGTLAKAATPLLKPLGEALGSLGGSVITAIANGFAALTPTFQILAPLLAKVGDVLGGAIATVFAALAPVMPPLAQAFADLVTALLPLVPLFAEILTMLAPVLDLFTQGLAVIVPIVAAIVEFVAQSDLLKVALAVITAAFIAWNIALNANPIGLIILAIVALVGGIKLLWEKNETFRTVVIAVWTAVKNAVLTVVDWFKTYVWPVLSWVIDKVVAYFKAYWTVVSYVWNAVYRAIEVVVSWFRETAWPWIKQVIDNASAGFQYLRGVVERVWGLITTAIRAAVDWFVQNVWPKIKPVIDLLAAGWDVIWTNVKRVWDTIITFLGGIVGKMLEIGGNIVQGIKDGIANAWNGFTSWVQEKINELPEAVKYVLGIASPSKVFAEIGGNIVEGFKIGVEPIGKVSDEVAGKIGRAASVSEQRINDWVAKQKQALDDAVSAWKDYRQAVFSSITGNVNIGTAWSDMEAQAQAVADAQKALTAAQAAAAAPDASAADQQAVVDAQAALAAAQSAAQSFEQNLMAQIEQSNLFGTMFAKASEALTAQFGKDSPVWLMMRDQMLQMGPEQGAAMATYIAQNGLSPTMQQALLDWNAWAGQVATDQAQKNYGQGVDMAKNALRGLQQKIKDEQARLERIGAAIGDGVIVGFQSKEGAFKAAVNSYIRAAMDSLGIHSPSTVFAEIGRQTAAGFNLGWDGAILDPGSLIPTPGARQTAMRSGFAPTVVADMQPPTVQVFIGERELTEIVDVRIQSGDARSLDYVTAGRRF